MTCPICLEKITNAHAFTVTQCNHMFHSKCIEKWTENKDSCPCCRHALFKLEEEEEPIIYAVYNGGRMVEIDPDRVEIITPRRPILDYGTPVHVEGAPLGVFLDYGDI